MRVRRIPRRRQTHPHERPRRLPRERRRRARGKRPRGSPASRAPSRRARAMLSRRPSRLRHLARRRRRRSRRVQPRPGGPRRRAHLLLRIVRRSHRRAVIFVSHPAVLRMARAEVSRPMARRRGLDEARADAPGMRVARPRRVVPAARDVERRPSRGRHRHRELLRAEREFLGGLGLFGDARVAHRAGRRGRRAGVDYVELGR